MTTSVSAADNIALFSDTGESWYDENAPDHARPLTWQPDASVTKVVVGKPPAENDMAEIRVTIPGNLAEIYPHLTHLHLWQISDLETLPELPRGLKCLDVRGCGRLRSLANLPATLETLVIDSPSVELTALPGSDVARTSLTDLSLRQCSGLPGAELARLLAGSPQLRTLDLSGGSFRELSPSATNWSWPQTLVDIRLNECRRLRRLPQAWPRALRRLELRHATAIENIPALPELADFIDLAYTKSLKTLPDLPNSVIEATQRRRPRTLFLFESGVDLQRDLLGETDDTNVAERVIADLDASEAGRKSDCELKVILLGNGRCGKSSLARRWIHGEFRSDEVSTHGVRLWKKEIPFTPEDALLDDADGTVRLNIWDFAGQDLYHSTHRLFLQSGAIFIICHNDHPPGADATSDERERAAMVREGEDVHRELKYWLDQVGSLGKIPGLEIAPPVLVVRTKSDRDDDRGTAPGPGPRPDDVVFSSKTGAGLPEIEEWLEAQAKRLLGKQNARSLPAPAIAVKQALRPLIQQNEELYWKMDEFGEVFQSPCPTISLQEFEDLVRKHCTGEYHDKPHLLLERFHRSGFVYYNAKHLKQTVILDQRWATQGIYAFSSRQSRYQIRERLLQSNGQFTREELANLSWRDAGYDDQAMDLLLSFMLSCGMCFELLRHDESASGRVVYAAPGFFPSREMAVARYPELAGDHEAWAQYQLSRVTESEIRSLIASFGAEWSRSMRAWRWGCSIVSAATGAVCWIDWPRHSDSQDYLFALDVWFSGPQDPAFEDFVRERVQDHLSHPTYSEKDHFESEWKPVEREELARESLQPSQPHREDATEVKVTLSFAGSDDQHGRVGDIPSTLGRKLHPYLQQHHRGKVLCYDIPEGPSRLPEFMEHLGKGDLMLVFWSKKYFYSPFCMTEMLLIHQQEPVGHLPDKRVLLYVLGDQRLSPDGPIGDLHWIEHWTNEGRQHEAAIRNEAKDDYQKETWLRERYPCFRWYEFLKRTELRDLATALAQCRIGRDIPVPESDDQVEKTATEIFELVKELLEDTDTMRDLALQRLEQGRKEDAVTLLLHALAMSPDSNRDVLQTLSTHGNQAIPDDLRLAAIDRLSDQGDPPS